MATEFKMPQLGLTMTEGVISKWMKNVGDSVAVGDLLVEVETDKIVNQLESPVDGTLLEILVPEGSAAPVQATIATIGAPGEKLEKRERTETAVETLFQQEPNETPTATVAASVAAGQRLKASPLAKKMAKDRGIAIADVPGTGPDGRVVKRDIVSYGERQQVRTSPLAEKVAIELGVNLTGIRRDSRIMQADVLAIAATAAPRGEQGRPLSGMRKIISERMSMSWQTSPHVNMTAEVDMSVASELKNMLAAANGKVSFTEIIVKCAAHALTEHKLINSSLADGIVHLHESINIGVAVALENGLIVPVIKNAGQKTVIALRDEIGELSKKARNGTLTQEEYQGGTFTVTNLGMFGVDHFTPIINQPESAILGVCQVVERAVVREGAVVIRPMMNLCLSFDHRLIDGAVGARFLGRLRQLLEQPLLLL